MAAKQSASKSPRVKKSAPHTQSKSTPAADPEQAAPASPRAGLYETAGGRYFVNQRGETFALQHGRAPKVPGLPEDAERVQADVAAEWLRENPLPLECMTDDPTSAPGSYATPAGEAFYIRKDGQIFAFEREGSDDPRPRSRRVKALPADARRTPAPLEPKPFVKCERCGSPIAGMPTIDSTGEVICLPCLKEAEQKSATERPQPPLPVEEHTVACAECGGDASAHPSLRAPDNKVLCASCSRATAPAATTRVAFFPAAGGENLFEVRAGVPVNSALEQLSLLLTQASALLGSVVCNGFEVSLDAISGIEHLMLAARAVGESVQVGLLAAQNGGAR